jgi:hypothetical protein
MAVVAMVDGVDGNGGGGGGVDDNDGGDDGGGSGDGNGGNDTAYHFPLPPSLLHYSPVFHFILSFYGKGTAWADYGGDGDLYLYVVK